MTGIKPEALLYLDHSKDSDVGEELLVNAGITFQKIICPKDFQIPEDDGRGKPFVQALEDGTVLPFVRAREGDFVGVERITDFVELVENTP